MYELAEELLTCLRTCKLTLAVAESCTGGGLGAAITAVPGSSEFFCGGFITYTNEQKQRLLQVDAMILEKFTAVSSRCAEAMACGASFGTGADIGVSTTGYAGPDGENLGLVYIGLSIQRQVFTCEYRFSGNREQIREQAVLAALRFLIENLSKKEEITK